MSYALRSIAFVAELIHAPVQHDPHSLQRLHGALFGSTECSYRDFRLVPGGAQFSNALGGMPGSPVSCANLLADRVQIREEQTGLSREEFEARVGHMAKAVLGALPVKLFLAQQYAVRSVINPQTTTDAREFMLRTLFGLDETLLSCFPAPPSLAGLRLAFPPAEEGNGIFNVRVESFSSDNRSLFLETVGTFGQPVQADAVDGLVQRFEATYEFQQEQLVAFVSQFDVEGE
ncbi:MAG TPA: hypothetical protein VFD43_07055 [Planctomycetota bacterium]|nr:hypothetical protein [Planctomycetota bacterium]